MSPTAADSERLNRAARNLITLHLKLVHAPVGPKGQPTKLKELRNVEYRGARVMASVLGLGHDESDVWWKVYASIEVAGKDDWEGRNGAFIDLQWMDRAIAHLVPLLNGTYSG